MLTWAAISSNPNNKEDPIDQGVLRGFETHFGAPKAAQIVSQYKVNQFLGFNPIIKRTVVKCGHDGENLVITKGLLNKILDTRHGLDAAQKANGEDDGGAFQWRSARISTAARMAATSNRGRAYVAACTASRRSRRRFAKRT